VPRDHRSFRSSVRRTVATTPPSLACCSVERQVSIPLPPSKYPVTVLREINAWRSAIVYSPHRRGPVRCKREPIGPLATIQRRLPAQIVGFVDVITPEHSSTSYVAPVERIPARPFAAALRDWSAGSREARRSR